jgi:hypothetical protein
MARVRKKQNIGLCSNKLPKVIARRNGRERSTGRNLHNQQSCLTRPADNLHLHPIHGGNGLRSNRLPPGKGTRYPGQQLFQIGGKKIARFHEHKMPPDKDASSTRIGAADTIDRQTAEKRDHLRAGITRALGSSGYSHTTSGSSGTP